MWTVIIGSKCVRECNKCLNFANVLKKKVQECNSMKFKYDKEEEKDDEATAKKV